MTEFERVLQECLHDIEEGVSSVDECLSRHSQYARQLEPILLTSAYLARGREARVSDAFRARVRRRLVREMYERPRKRAVSGFHFMRLATSLAVILLALLATGTVYAQSALPGEPFYGWKLASENVWRAVSPDPVAIDLAIADRRVEELIAVRNDPALYALALNAYLEVSARLRLELDTENAAQIMAALESHAETLNQSGVILPQPELVPGLTPPLAQPTSTPASDALPSFETPVVQPTGLPSVIPTVDLPAPTVEVPPVVLPTVEDPSDLLPTLELPAPVP